MTIESRGVPQKELAAGQAGVLLGVIDQYEEALIRGTIVDPVNHKTYPFKGAVKNLYLVGELMPHVLTLIQLTGDSIRFGHSGLIHRVFGTDLEIGNNEAGEIGLKLAVKTTKEHPSPIIKNQDGLARAREQDKDAVRAFGALTGLELLNKYRTFALKHAGNQRPRYGVPSSSGGRLPWV